MKLTNELMSSRLVAIVRGIKREEARAAGAGLAAGGVKLMEVTMNTAGALDIMQDWRSAYDGQAYVGAGTVLNVNMAREAVSAGAQFLISPNVDMNVISFALEQGIDIWPGAMTPTEIAAAFYAGAEVVKLFPMASLGLEYLREIRGPLNHIPLIATGGVTPQNIADYFEAGASAVGIGSSLLPKDALAKGNTEEIAQCAARFVQAAVRMNP
ncbi:bifunctional 4-hydroxy-2-oxoglutarate aldolase/2-dehydro-3-deoxy-phosphogluconate aldolase [Paenibacillus dokdonensis]|uniref:Bifunctional 4-hydroxy-2-oxoglutarate aldolase/2-dehydro-3-deoxy-phosphogluconate aldolase n=1 Tax=Paenibacillus dokdonensis TaxID=2567944 RepID=A0ABU6GVJ8_9BACL|nr:bifunctional 4-hydroxy-2-oxoglutarate aldolase/2-dehydro-3-deoxy-phosphogluconate aldolase [Paenibacillus dokdonensis]MEC0243723.1 bifunctional 4-hydroxy-2-oxoglutarate aldolase/2-dehydro-3-deoxy-phosphogluconate aldolase [Paenibacillus dokdonensis]